MTPLHRACVRGDLEAVGLELERDSGQLVVLVGSIRELVMVLRVCMA
jgi:hypothetical protein